MNTNNLTLDESTNTDVPGQTILVSEKAISKVCECVCSCLGGLDEQEKPSLKSRKKKIQKIVAMYKNMVVVSTCAILWLEGLRYSARFGQRSLRQLERQLLPIGCRHVFLNSLCVDSSKRERQ